MTDETMDPTTQRRAQRTFARYRDDYEEAHPSAQ